ncbi:MAG: hypothetical protein WBH50_16140 [Fuerstiella sp.]
MRLNPVHGLMAACSVIFMFQTTAQCNAQTISRPLWIEFDNGLHTPDYALTKTLLINEACPEKYQRKFDVAALERMSKRYYEFVDIDGFEPVGGIATCLDANGAFIKLRFRTVPGREVFESFVADQMAKRGDTASAVWNEDTVTISKPPVRESSRAVRSFSDLHISYRSSVVVWATPNVTQAAGAPFEDIHEIAKKSGNHDWSFYASPSAVSSRYRQSALAMIDRFVSVQVQKRDGEPEAAYNSRKAASELRNNLIERAMYDVDEVFVSFDEPTTSEDFQCELRVTLIKGSTLAKTTSQFRSSASTSQKLSVGNAVQAWLNFKLPNSVSEPLSVIVANSFPPDSAAGAALCGFIQNAKINAEIAVADNGQEAASAFLRCDSSTAVLAGLLQLAGTPDAGHAPLSEILNASAFEPWKVYWDACDDGLLISLNEIDSSAPKAQPDTGAPKTDAPIRSISPLIDLQLNLTDLAKQETNEHINSQFELAERLYQYYVGLPYKNMFRGRSKMAAPAFESMISMLPKEQPLRLSFGLDCSSNGAEISGNLRITRGLYAWMLARRHVSQLSVFSGFTTNTAKMN